MWQSVRCSSRVSRCAIGAASATGVSAVTCVRCSRVNWVWPRQKLGEEGRGRSGKEGHESTGCGRGRSWARRGRGGNRFGALPSNYDTDRGATTFLTEFLYSLPLPLSLILRSPRLAPVPLLTPLRPIQPAHLSSRPPFCPPPTRPPHLSHPRSVRPSAPSSRNSFSSVIAPKQPRPTSPSSCQEAGLSAASGATAAAPSAPPAASAAPAG